VTQAKHRVLRKGLQGYAHERKEVCDGDGPAFFFGPGPLLDEGVHRDDKKTSGDTEESELNEDCQVADARAGKQCCHQKDAA
jgi:hypothetical protein